MDMRSSSMWNGMCLHWTYLACLEPLVLCSLHLIAAALACMHELPRMQTGLRPQQLARYHSWIADVQDVCL